MKKLFLLMPVLLFMLNCSSAAKMGDDITRQWMMISFKDFSRDDLVKNRAMLDLSSTKSPKNQFTAFMGCNHMFLTAEFKKNGSVKFSKIGSTMMYCENNMDMESQFASELPKMTYYKIDGHHLTLSDRKGNTMKFVAADWD